MGWMEWAGDAGVEWSDNEVGEESDTTLRGEGCKKGEVRGDVVKWEVNATLNSGISEVRRVSEMISRWGKRMGSSER